MRRSSPARVVLTVSSSLRYAANKLRSGSMRALTLLALLLAALAGGVDAIGWLTLDGLFVAHMSGNTVGLTTHVALGEWSEVGRRAFVIVAFAIGLALGAGASTYAARRAPRAGFAIALAIEALLLVLVLLGGLAASRGTHVVAREPRGPYYALVAVTSAAMGIQSATLRRVGQSPVRTTYVTGVLTRFVESVVHALALTWARRRGRERPGDDDARRKASAQARLLASVWLFYATGGVASALLVRCVGFLAVLVPLGLVVLASALDFGLVRAGVEGAGPEES